MTARTGTGTGTGSPAVDVPHPFLGDLELIAGDGPDGTAPKLLFCENETNLARLYGATPTTAYPKDGINDHVVAAGAATVNPEQRGTKCSFWYRLTVPAGGTAELRIRLRPAKTSPAADTAQADPLGDEFTSVNKQRQTEADQFYADLSPEAAPADAAHVMRQAFAGLLWCKQFYYFDVTRWLSGDPAQPAPPPGRQLGRNNRWRTSTPSTSCRCRTSGNTPGSRPGTSASTACPWPTSTRPSPSTSSSCCAGSRSRIRTVPCPPTSGTSVTSTRRCRPGPRSRCSSWTAAVTWTSCPRIFDKLLINFTWWVNREDENGNNVFQGGFLGLDNIGPIDRSHLPVGGTLEQSDATGWMGFYAISIAGIATVLYRSGRRPSEDIVLKFLEHFAAITKAINSQGLWDDNDGLYYDKLLTQDGTAISVRTRSMVGVIPILAVALIDQDLIDQALRLGKQFADFLRRANFDDIGKLTDQGLVRGAPGDRRVLLTLTGVDQLEKTAGACSTRASSCPLTGCARCRPTTATTPTCSTSRASSPPSTAAAESTTAMFGGNSNWRGPIWFPLNFLIVSVLERYYLFFGDDVTVEYPVGSGHQLNFDQITCDLRDRLISIFLVGPDGRRPCFGGVDKLQHDPAWKDNLLFNEYFHGDNAAGPGRLAPDRLDRRGRRPDPPPLGHRALAAGPARPPARPGSSTGGQVTTGLPGSPFPLGATLQP